MGNRADDIYEVFAQPDHGRHHIHQFSLRAGSPEMALALARELFLRREQWVSVWVVPRSAVVAASGGHPARPQRTLDRSYREPAGYRHLGERWRRYMLEAMDRKTLL